MTHFTEFTIEETALEWLKGMGYQRTAFGETDKRMKSHKGTMTDSCILASLCGGLSMPGVMRWDDGFRSLCGQYGGMSYNQDNEM